MYQAGTNSDSDKRSLEYAYVQFEKMCEAIVSKRSKVYLPAPQQINQEIDNIVDRLLQEGSSDLLLTGA
jgi:Mg2+ and Co2+ transporter CorA